MRKPVLGRLRARHHPDAQRTFAGPGLSRNKKDVARRERSVAEIDAVVPWVRAAAAIEPHYPKAGRGRQPLGMDKVLRVYCLQ